MTLQVGSRTEGLGVGCKVEGIGFFVSGQRISGIGFKIKSKHIEDLPSEGWELPPSKKQDILFFTTNPLVKSC